MLEDSHRPLLKTVIRPLEIVCWLLIAFGFMAAPLLRFPASNQDGYYFLLLASAVYVFAAFRILLPLAARYNWIFRLNVILGLALPAVFFYLTGLKTETVAIFLLLVTYTGVQLGKRMAALVAGLSALSTVVILIFHNETGLIEMGAVALQFGLYLLSGSLVANMSDRLRVQAREAEARSRNLSLLLEMHPINNSFDLETSLPALAEKVVRGLSCSFCCIYLLERDRKEWVNYGFYPVRAPGESEAKTGRRYPVDALRWHARTLKERQLLVLRQDTPAPALDEQEAKALLFDGVQSACLAPLWFENEPLGVLAVGEVRGWEREPFTSTRLDLLAAIAAQISVVVNNARLHQATRRQVEHMEVVNQVTRAIASAIEMDDLLELIFEQLSRVIPTDTYFVGLLNEDGQTIDLRIVYDEGVRFPPYRMPYGAGLVSYVIDERKPLLIRCLEEEITGLPAHGVIVGNQKISQSWLGVPMLSDGKPTGVLALASYARGMFDEEDQALLITVAGQATIALDNARHHAQVEEQSRCDSLTGIYNHGYFYQKLREAAAEALLTSKPLSLIMLDIDHFKGYNDAYGHVKGDEVLRMTVDAIQSHLSPNDFVGRWGGEEFDVALPGAGPDQARRVAESIRRTLAVMSLFDRRGLPIPPPTVSQGIASIPLHAMEADLLVDVADQTLYLSKHGGRDQVLVALNGMTPLDMERKDEGSIRI